MSAVAAFCHRVEDGAHHTVRESRDVVAGSSYGSAFPFEKTSELWLPRDWQCSCKGDGLCCRKLEVSMNRQRGD